MKKTIFLIFIFLLMVTTVCAGTLSWKVPEGTNSSQIYVEKYLGEYQDGVIFAPELFITTETSYDFDLPNGIYRISIISIDDGEPSPRSDYYWIECKDHYAPYGLKWEE